jgi:hypothetical protein
VKFAALLLVILVAAAGCGGPVADYSMVDLVNGQGVVTLDGKPLASAVVTFEDPTDETFSYAMTDADGKYVLQFDSEMKGVKTGKKVVRISTTRKILGLNSKPGQAPEGEDGTAPKAPAPNGPVGELVPERYNKNSELAADVVQGTTQYDFALQSK